MVKFFYNKMGISELNKTLEEILIEIKNLNKTTIKTRRVISIVNVVNIITLIVLIILISR